MPAFVCSQCKQKKEESEFACQWPLLSPPVTLCKECYAHPHGYFTWLKGESLAPPDDFDYPEDIRLPIRFR